MELRPAAQPSASGPELTFAIPPFALIHRYLRTGYVLRTYRRAVSSTPLELSLSKPCAHGNKAATGSARTVTKRGFDTSARTGLLRTRKVAVPQAARLREARWSI
jgi:hypothetical protein